MCLFSVLCCFPACAGGAASPAHPVHAAPPQAPGLCAQLPPASGLECQGREPGAAHQTYLLCESSVTESL